MFQIIMMILGFGSGIYNLCQGLGIIKIKNSDEMDSKKLAGKKQMLIFSSFVMFGIGVIYTLEFLGIW
ncbi:hypothetical protein [Paraglaciecola sp. 25GB23A]|uniref:hypothetical protein n=1 Tax=Paraglaciecola sp. 25GB23A TaxID=3156068 RepID=UPI0032AFF599